MNKLSEPRVAIVTGGSRGIGRAIAEQLGAIGYHVVVNYHSQSAAADEVVAAIQASGGQAFAFQANIADRSDQQKLVAATLAQFGRLDLLVNNAGIASPGRKDLLEATEESWDMVFATNLKGPFFLTQLAANKMIKLIHAGKMTQGKIINISSISAYTASINRGDYCMSKAALSMMTALYADRLAEEKINVYEICPGVIASDMTAPVKAKYDALIAGGMSPIRRWGETSDVAQAVAALALDYFPFSTGQQLHVDGGFHLKRL